MCQAWEEKYAAHLARVAGHLGEVEPVQVNRVQGKCRFKPIFCAFCLAIKNVYKLDFKGGGGNFRMCRIPPPSIKSRLQNGFEGYPTQCFKPRKTGAKWNDLGNDLDLQSS